MPRFVGGLMNGRIWQPSGGAAAFSLLDLSPHAWYRETYASGTWTDLSGNGNNIVQAAGFAQPAQVTRYGQSWVLSFDGNDYMVGTYHTPLSQPFSIALVAEMTNFDTFRGLVDGDDGTDRSVVEGGATSGDLRVFAGALHTGPVITAATVHAILVEVNGASSKIWLDDWTDGAVDNGNAGAHLPDGITIGASFVGGSELLGFIAEVVVVSAALTPAQRKSLGDLWTADYDGLTVVT